MNFVERITGLLSSPDKTMKDIANEPRIEEALLIVAVYAIFAAISAYVTATKIKYIYTDSSLDMGPITTIMSIVTGIIAPFISWVIVAAVLYLFSMVFGGEGKFMNVLTALGYTDLVKIFAMIIAVLLLTQAPVLTLEVSASNPLSSLSGMGDYYKNPFVLLSSVVGLLGLLWSSLLGVFAIKHTEKLSFTSAAIVVGVPLVLYIIVQYSSLLLSFL